ncbi:MAG: hypothetical protein A2360_04925 [Candidatus Staskawiczbacteria bacterium RIFOXYB1_FULL_32_11]|uniref:Uncharacterized protein n=1 Tax=Candidatus Staskawiczbacteria bacterium RIFOXYD1_FULL_32_13 TaxID=1802234 RepID=A0A1G2JLX1_9BACT|nr:MAG: hypothetical protein UR22_C0001G0008 [Parcubacteria group bacterium GW2011_GWC2_32_10]OGZ77719.1 MAG: hypothetical protein A2256_01490 [Candidatus Staskawiczbacteria bacterium RIFOXYA2_FULL_32_7]OGZ79759.1 MAG: hypothetical protein A2360_04925 [Candidatus Staskawiczbacteria bacterium RIFOXYB1_FULL_32_11]OGZ88137.1 MAG: hypothetical protein A2561_05520 [Candidatus Staskawiczbacteria bacterium RIFOXYD1_FULL_32_13]
MPKFNPDNLNIHELAVEEPEKQAEVFFDPEKEITEDDWEGINKNLKTYEENSGFWQDRKDFNHWQTRTPNIWLVDTMELIKIIDPKREFSEYELKILAHEYKKAYDGAEQGEEPWDLVVYGAAHSKIINKDYDLNLTSADKEKIGQIIENSRKKVTNFLSLLASAKISGLDKNYLPEIDDLLWAKIEEHIENLAKDQKWHAYIMHLRDMKIINPNHKLDLNSQRLEEIKKTMEQYKEKKDWSNFFYMASLLTIITTDEIKILEGGGLELIRHKSDFGTETSQVPEQKQF